MQNENLCCFAVGQKIGLVFANASRTNLCFCVQAVKSSLRKGTRHLNKNKDTGSPPQKIRQLFRARAETDDSRSRAP